MKTYRRAFLREHGHEVTRVAGTPLSGRTDSDLLKWARKNGAAIITLDEDFTYVEEAAS